MLQNRKNLVFLFLFIFSDIILIYATFLIAYWVRFNIPIIPITKGIPPLEAYREVIPLAVLIWIFAFKHYDLYQTRNRGPSFDEFFSTFKAVTLGTLLVMAATFLYRGYSYSRVVIAYAWVLGIVLVSLGRTAIRSLHVALNNTSTKQKIVVIGKRTSLTENILGVLEKTEGRKCLLLEGNPSTKELRRELQDGGETDVVVADPNLSRKELMEIAMLCEGLGIRFRYIPDIFDLELGALVMDEQLGLPVHLVKPTPLRGLNLWLKRLLDIILSGLALLLLSIPFLAIAILIKLDSPGPVLYLQKRMGKGGKEFSFLKFRTMILGADDMLEKLKPLSEREGPVFKMKNDPRITRVGKFLRKYSLDELPQLFNVLRGDMSLVGPRPQVLWEAAYYDEWAKRRLQVMPGITGLWQVSGRTALSYDEMIRLDLYYIENWSFELDLKILLQTFLVIIRGEGM